MFKSDPLKYLGSYKLMTKVEKARKREKMKTFHGKLLLLSVVTHWLILGGLSLFLMGSIPPILLFLVGWTVAAALLYYLSR